MKVSGVFLLAFLSFAASANACGVLKSASPRVGSTVSAVNDIILNFSDAVDAGKSTITVTDSSGHVVSEGKTFSAGDAAILTTKTKNLPPGQYKVQWSAYWPDCDSQSDGDFPFTVQ